MKEDAKYPSFFNFFLETWQKRPFWYQQLNRNAAGCISARIITAEFTFSKLKGPKRATAAKVIVGILLDILANNKWERPIYFVTGYHDDALGLEEYMQLEGLAYRLVPIKSANRGILDYGRIDSDILYNNLINKFVWGGANDPSVNIDYNHRRTLLVIRARLTYAKLARKLAGEGKKDKAQEVLDYVMEKLPLENIQYDPYIPDIVEGYFAAGNHDKGVEMSKQMILHYTEVLDYYLKQKPVIVQSAEYEVGTAIQNMSKLAATMMEYGEPDIAKDLNTKVEEYYNRYVGGMPAGRN